VDKFIASALTKLDKKSLMLIAEELITGTLKDIPQKELNRRWSMVMKLEVCKKE